jgi:acetyl-CoA synthetase
MAQDSSLAESENRGRHDLFPARLPADLKSYHGLYHKCGARREEFWQYQSGRLRWDTPFRTVVNEDMFAGRVAWFADGTLNACRNALDAHFERGWGDRRALLFIDGEGEVHAYTYRDLDGEVRLLAAAMKEKGLKPGDRVALYLPDSPETLFFLLACSFLGIIPVPIPIRYTAELTREILQDCDAALLAVHFGSGPQAYEARARAVSGSAAGIPMVDTGGTGAEGTVSYAEFVAKDTRTPLDSPASVDAEHPLFILYANTAAGVPRGSVFATGGFLVQAATSFDYLFASAVDDVEVRSLVCLPDLSSVAGLCYGVWGPLLNGSCTVISAEGTRTVGERLSRALEVCESPALLAAPTHLEDLKRELDGKPLSSERRFALAATSGDVLKPRQIQFAARALVSRPEHVLNLWIQSECGASVINTFPSPELNRAGALGLPFTGIEPLVLNSPGQVCRANESGQLVFRSSWPSMIRTIYGQDERYRQLYFQRIPGYYSTNDGARVDGDGFFWFMGRLDDVI